MEPYPVLDIFKPCLGQIHVKLYDTLCRTKRPKTIPCPAAHTRIGHIREYPPPPHPGLDALARNWRHITTDIHMFLFIGHGPPSFMG